MTTRAVLFDLFDTLVVFDRDRLPELTLNGRTVRSTAALVHEVLVAHVSGVDLPVFADALAWSWREAERVRDETHREVSAHERYGLVFQRLGMDPAALPPGLVTALLERHMRELARAVYCPPHHRALLESLRKRHRLAVVSNFDYTPTAELILEREGLTPLFDTVVVSDAVGWRKPKAVIFELALGRLEAQAADALFVGDRVDIDVAGAHGVGMRAAWINRAGDALPAGFAPPDYEIRDLAELAPILGA